MIKSDNITKLAGALLKAQKNMGAALKDSKNPFFKSKYADLNSVIDAAIPSLNEAGIVVLQVPTTEVNHLGQTESSVETILLHESGEYIGSKTPIVCSKQNDPQALGSAISYARRYGLQATVTLKAEDDDGEKAMGRAASTETTAAKPILAPAASGITVAQVAAKAAPITETTAPAPFKRSKPASATKSKNEDI